MSAFSLGLLLGPQLYLIWHWRGAWRWLAAVPLLLMVAFIALIPVLVSYEPRIADTWLLFVQIICYVSPLWLGLLLLTRLIIRWATVF
jgi:hypothetical protein